MPGVGNMVSVVQVAEPRGAVAAAPSGLQGNLRPDPSPLALGPVISPFQRVWELPVSGREAAWMFLCPLALGGPSPLSDGKLKPQCLPKEGGV